MKLLFDQNISFRLIKQIENEFPEARQIRTLGLENKSDREIWEYARIENYTIVTFDADFYDLSIIYKHPPKVIWLRLKNTTTEGIKSILLNHKNTISEFLIEEQLSCLEIIKRN